MKKIKKTTLALCLMPLLLPTAVLSQEDSGYNADRMSLTNGRMNMTGSSLANKDGAASAQNSDASASAAASQPAKPASSAPAKPAAPAAKQLPKGDSDGYVASGSGGNIVDGLLKQAQFWHSKQQHGKAVQSLKRVLLSDPHNEEALYLMSLWSYEVNDKKTALEYRDKLAKLAPNSGYIQMLDNQRGISDLSSDQLTHARALAASGNINGALIEYQKLFTGATPPKALVSEYYLTMSGDPNHFDRALNGMVNYIRKNPKDINAQITYGKLLTYRKSSIRKGIELLEYYAPHSDDADKALRQALLWLSPTDEDEKLYQKYLARHANDNEVRSHFDDTIVGNLQAKAFSDAELDKQDAIETFEKILKKNPKNQDALEGIGYLYMDMKNYLKAKEYLTKAAELGGPKEKKLKHDALMAAVNLSVSTGDLNLARETLDTLLAETPYDMDALLLKADICKKQKRFTDAELALRTALSNDPLNEGVNESLYYLYKDQGKLDSADSLLASMPSHVAQKIRQATAAKVYVDPIPPIRSKAQSFADAGAYPQAINTLQEGIQKYPDATWLRYDLCRLLDKQGFAAGAANELNYLTRTGANSEDLMAAASILNERKQFNEALNVIKRIPNQNASVAKLKEQLIINQGFASVEEYLKAGNRSAAYNSLKMMQIKPSELTTSQLAHLSYLYLRCGQKDKALAIADEAAARPISSSAGISEYADLVTVYNELGYYDRAQALTSNQSIINNSSQSDLDALAVGDNIRKADSLRTLKHYADAYDLLYPMIEQDPQNPALNMAMARIYQDNGDYATALAIYRRVLQNDPNNQAAIEGGINAALGDEDYDEATYLADRLTTSNDPRVLTLLARVDAKNNNYKAAINKLTSARAMLDRRYAYPTMNSSTSAMATNVSSVNHMPGNPFSNKVDSSQLKQQTVTLPWESAAGSVTMPIAGNLSIQDREDALNDINFMIRDLQDKVSATIKFGIEANQKDGEDGLSKVRGASIPVTFTIPVFNGSQLSLTAEAVSMDSGSLSNEKAIYEHGTNALQTGYANRQATISVVMSNIASLRTEYQSLMNNQWFADNMLDDFKKQNGLLNMPTDEFNALMGVASDGKTPLDASIDPFIAASNYNTLSNSIGRANVVGFLSQFSNPYALVAAMKGAASINSVMSGAKVHRTTGVAFNIGLKDDNYAFDFGVTPVGKKGTTVVGGAYYRFNIDSHSNLSVKLERRAMKDSLLSYFGYKDEMSGTYWGGVTKNGGEISYSYDDGYFGYGLTGSAYTYRGENVKTNNSYSFGGTVYVHPIRPTMYEDMTLGISLTYQNFSHNQNHFSFGNGGYFSPQNYLIASIPFTYMKRTEKLKFTASASLGYQTYRQNEEDYYPNNPSYQSELESLAAYGLVSEYKFEKKSESGIGGQIKLNLDYYLLDDLVVGGYLGYSTYGEYKELNEMLYIKSVLGDL